MVIVHIELLVYPKVTHPELQNWTIKHSLNMVETTQQEFFLDVLTSFTVVVFILRGCTILKWEFREIPLYDVCRFLLSKRTMKSK